MERQRGELVPISGLAGPVKAIRKASPQALHHFTQADQVNQLISASEADPNRGFLARTMALYTTAPGVLILHPSTTAIPPVDQGPLAS